MELDLSKPAPKPKTLKECHELIDILWKALGKMQKKFWELDKRLEILTEKININSKNSSMPPSSDFVKKKKSVPKKSKKKRKQGGQPGHKGQTRTLLAIESERTGMSRKIGRNLLVYCKKMFTLWHRVKAGKLSRKKFKALMKPIQKKVEFLLRQGSCCGHKKTERTCKNILKIKKALWTFVSVLNVEPTNNLAEQLIRAFVIWRKTSFGTQSAEGSRYMERVLTVVATCNMQKRNVLDFISQAIKAHFGEGTIPSLIPVEINQSAVNGALAA